MSTRRALATLLTATAVFLTGSAAYAGRIDAGTVEAGADLMLDFEGANGTTISGDLLGGYFILDGVLVGGRVGLYNDDALSLFSAFLIGEQHFETDTPWIPYIGASLGVLHAKAEIGETSDSTTALAIGATGGLKFYITETAAFDINLNLVLASDDVFVADAEAESIDMTLKAGLRFFLF